MGKVTIDRETFKALASDVRLDILKSLDGRKMNLSEISRKTGLSKATVLEHLNKLLQADLVKKIERKGHKWTYYKLSWKGSSLLHPENTKIVITFCLSFLFLFAGISQMVIYSNGFYTYVSGKIPVNASLKPSEDLIKNLEESHPIMEWARNVHVDTIYLNNSATEGYTIGGSNETEHEKNKVSTYENGTPVILRIFYQNILYFYSSLACISISSALILVGISILWKRREPAF